MQGHRAHSLAPFASALTAILTLLAPPVTDALAQVSDEAIEESDRQRQRDLRAFRKLDDAAEAALFTPFEETERVTFADVLRSPDDPELNFRWAKTQVADGDLTGASATLHRVLLNQPDLQRVRLFYAIVLFRLGNLPDADAQFERLERELAEPTSSSLRDQAARYREQIEQQRRRTRHTLLLSGGSVYDSNKNSGPSSDQISLLDTRIDLGTANRQQGDSAWFSLAQWTTEHDLGRQEDQQLVAATTYFHTQQDDFRVFDVQALQLELGLRTRRAGSLLHPRIVADLVDLSRENYLRSVGFELEAERPLSARATLNGKLRVTHEDFDGTPDAVTASERSGYRTVVDSELALALSPRQRLSLLGELTHKSADQTYHAYSGWELGIAHQWVLPQGLFLLSSASLGFDRYKKNQDAISSSTRRDLRSRARLSIGVPFGAVLPDRFEAIRDVILAVGGEVQIHRSNLPNYEFRNRKLTLSLTKRFGL